MDTQDGWRTGTANRLDFSANTATQVLAISANNAQVVYCYAPPRPVKLLFSLANNQLTAGALIFPAGFRLLVGSQFNLSNNPGLGLPFGDDVAALIAAGKLPCNSINIANCGIDTERLDAIAAALWQQRVAYVTAKATGKALYLAQGAVRPTGVFQAPVTYAPGLSEAELTTRSAAWSALEKLWVLRFGGSSAYPSYGFSVLTY
jgi:hypothetical protein